MAKPRALVLAGFTVALAGCGGRAATDHGESAGGAPVPASGGSDSPPLVSGSSGGLLTGGISSGGGSELDAGTSPSACTGSLADVSQALGSTCPVTLCGATAWGIASCSGAPSTTSAADQDCGGVHALVVNRADGSSKICVYQPTPMPNPGGLLGNAMDGPLVGAMAVGVANQFCAGTSRTISAGQQRPLDCSDARPRMLCDRALVVDAGAPDDGRAAPRIEVCLNDLSSSCTPCCPATPPDCSAEPDGYPGYSCTPTGAPYCSCSCSRGAWQCGC